VTERTLAEAFARLHRKGDPLLLANAWDAASAAVIEAAGASAIATTSSGMAWAMGVPDGGVLGAHGLSSALSRIVAAVSVPVSADIEDGYGAQPRDVAETVRVVVDAGAVGINLEDRPGGQRELFSPAHQAARIAAARAIAEAAGCPLWINARTDTYLVGVGAAEKRVALTLRLAEIYAEAGADSLFVPGAIDPETVAALVAGPLPLNIMVWTGAPPVTELAALGVARISLGGAIAEAAYGLADRAAREMFTTGTYDQTAGGLPYATLNGLLSGT
jgi:2-methylisocitrate lyase-like PEP mutase family enzyme